MPKWPHILTIRHSLIAKLIIAMALSLLITVAAWAYFNINYQKSEAMAEIISATDRLTTTIRLGTHYAMMLNSRHEINQIINNIAKLDEIRNIRIYNKDGEIKFSNHADELDQITNIRDEACYICHRNDPPRTGVDLSARTRIFTAPNGNRHLGIITPICNEPSCTTGDCHVHPSDKKILGALDVVISLSAADQKILHAEKNIILLALLLFLVISALIGLFLLKFVNQPIKKLIKGTWTIAQGDYSHQVDVRQVDEMGMLAEAINRMGRQIGAHHATLEKQRIKYRDLFERVPCLITVQDRRFRLLNFNREFAQRFDPAPGQYCFRAYKGLSQKCPDCPVDKTFQDGQAHYSEQTGVDKDGAPTYWIVKTSPIIDETGQIAAAMEISLDITQRRELEQKLAWSEKKYHAIFDNIPNPVFVLDIDTLEILDCNASVTKVYGYRHDQLCGQSFLALFKPDEKDHYAFKLMTASVINQVKQIDSRNRTLFVTIRMASSEYSGQKVLLVTTSDITKRLEVEQQLIQASKMATLGEMATGIAHELNQPLSVIKTASSFLVRKNQQHQCIAADTLTTLLTKIDANVDRASKIINHMRQFARKTDLALSRIQINTIIERAFDIFSQQLKVRGIDVAWELNPRLPDIHADPDRLEQVFINLLLNARDAIEDRWGTSSQGLRQIKIQSTVHDGLITVSVCDSGIGIDSGIVDKVFEPFFTTKEVGKGTGLGLSISYGIVKECGGQITARNNPDGAGACFDVHFPQIDPPGAR